MYIKLHVVLGWKDKKKKKNNKDDDDGKKNVCLDSNETKWSRKWAKCSDPRQGRSGPGWLAWGIGWKGALTAVK